MPYNTKLKLPVNAPPARVTQAFNTPKTFDSKRNPGSTTYMFTLKMLEAYEADGLKLEKGEDVAFFTENERLVESMAGLEKGEPFRIYHQQQPGAGYSFYEVQPEEHDEDVSPFEPSENGDEARLEKRSSKRVGRMKRATLDALRVREEVVAQAREQADEETAEVLNLETGEYYLTKVALTFWMNDE